MKRMSKPEVAEAARKHLANRPMNGLVVEVFDERIRRQNACWRIPIRVNKEPRRLMRLYEYLAEVECDLEDSEGLNVSFDPAGETWAH